MTAFAGATLLGRIRGGEYLDRARVRRLAVIYLVVGLLSLGALIATSDGFKDRLGRPLGTDFMAFYVAGAIADEKGGAAAYDAAAQYAEHQRLIGEEKPPFWPYLYPPAFLFVAMALASLPYLAAWLLWSGGTLALYLGAMQRLAPGAFAALLAAAFPAVLTNFMHGQNGFLIAALFAAAAHCLIADRKLAAGLAFGLIAVKPQYGLLIPIALVAAGEWRVFAAAAASVLALALAPTFAFGVDVWPGFFETMRAARIEVLETGAIGFEKIQSVFSQAKMLGAPTIIAYAAQGIFACGLAVMTARLWRGRASRPLKLAGLIIASLLAPPYVVDYDLVILAPAMALLITQGAALGFRPYERTLLLAAAVTPLIARPVGAAAPLSLGLLAMIALFAAICARAANETAGANSKS
jgi:hypothetical protein